MRLIMFASPLVKNTMPDTDELVERYRKITEDHEAQTWFKTSNVQWSLSHLSYPRGRHLLMPVELTATHSASRFDPKTRTMILGNNPERHFIQILRLDALWSDAVFTNQDLMADVFLMELLDLMGEHAHVITRWTDMYGPRLGH